MVSQLTQHCAVALVVAKPEGLEKQRKGEMKL